MTQAASVLTPYFKRMEEHGGYGTCHINFKRGQLDPELNRERISGLRFKVEVMYPFAFNGEELIAIGNGTYESKTSYLVASVADLNYNLQQGRLHAFKEAVRSLEKDIRLEMLRARPATTPAKQNRKICTIFRAMSVIGLVDVVERPLLSIPALNHDPWEDAE